MTRRTREYFRITKHTRRYNRKTNTFTINIAYQTATQKTPRTLQVAEAFGLGTDQQQKFTIYDNLKLKITPTDIIHITGDSGSGKSILLKTLKKDLKHLAADTADLTTEQNKPIINTVGKTFPQALELLSKVGLNDAFLFTRKYNQLSDGQKIRYQIAKLIETDKQWWIIDEFCSLLDRDTAKIVAYNTQKQARQKHKALITATTHTDLQDDLKPTIHIHKRYGKEITIHRHPNTATHQCTLTRQMHVEEGNINDYKQLAPFHYRTSHLPPPRKIFTLKRKNELCGVIVYSHPPPTTHGRNKATKTTFQQIKNQLSTISRVIIHPKYRTIGLGAKIVQETLKKAPTPYVETLAVMAKYNPFFEKAGMQKITESKPTKNTTATLEQLKQLGFNQAMIGSENYNQQKIEKTDKQKLIQTLKELSKKESALRKRLLCLPDVYPKHEEFTAKIERLNDRELAKTIKRLAIIAQTKVYLFWPPQTNPNHNKTEQ